MRRHPFPAALAAVLLASLAAAQEPTPLPLEVKGEGVRTVTVIDKLPATVHAPAGSALYFWTFPSSVKAVDRGDRLEITSAPKGEVTIALKAVSVDWEGRKFITKLGGVVLNVGNVPGPKPPPEPDPVDPTDALTKSITAAYAAEADPAKATHAKNLATVYAHGQGRIYDTSTWGDFFKALGSKAQEVGASGKLPGVQKAIQAEALKVLPGSASMTAPIATADRDRGSEFFGRVVGILEGVAK